MHRRDRGVTGKTTEIAIVQNRVTVGVPPFKGTEFLPELGDKDKQVSYAHRAVIVQVA